MLVRSSVFSSLIVGLCLSTSVLADIKTEKNIIQTLLQAQQSENFTGAYLATRAARIKYDFKNAQKNAYTAFVLSSKDDAMLADQAIRLSVIQGQLDTALAIARQHNEAVLKNDKKPQVGVFSILILLIDAVKSGNKQNALEIFEKYKDSFNTPMRSLIGGTIYRFNGENKKAENAESELKGFALLDMIRTFHTAGGEYVSGNKNNALQLYIKAADFPDTLAVRAVLSSVSLYLEQGQKEEASKFLDIHRKHQPDGLIWSIYENFEKISDFKFDLPKNYAEVLGEDFYNIGILYARQLDYESSIAFLRTAQQIGVSHPYLLSALAETYSIIGDYDTAAQIYLDIAKDNKFLIGRESLIGASFTLNSADRFDQAEKLLLEAMKTDNKYYRYPYVLGDLHRGRKEFDKAIPYFTKALELIGEKESKIKWRILYGRGISYERTNQWDKAEKDLLAALTLAPNNPEMINYLAYSWVDRNINLDKALLMLQHAVNRRPDNGYITDSLGWALFRLEKYDEALPIIETAAALMPSDPIINDHLGDVYWKVGRQREAHFQWSHALSFEPEEKEKKIIAAKMQVGYDQADKFLKDNPSFTGNEVAEEASHLNKSSKQDDKEQISGLENFLEMIKDFFRNLMN